jgi:hypothetical protein
LANDQSLNGLLLSSALRWASRQGLRAISNFGERAMNQRQTADAIEHEYNAAELGIRKYRSMGDQEALALLAEEVEWLREEQRKREQQLDQPPEVRSTHTE